MRTDYEFKACYKKKVTTISCIWQIQIGVGRFYGKKEKTLVMLIGDCWRVEAEMG